MQRKRNIPLVRTETKIQNIWMEVILHQQRGSAKEIWTSLGIMQIARRFETMICWNMCEEWFTWYSQKHLQKTNWFLHVYFIYFFFFCRGSVCTYLNVFSHIMDITGMFTEHIAQTSEVPKSRIHIYIYHQISGTPGPHNTSVQY